MGSGNVPERGTQKYLDYVEGVLKTQTDAHEKRTLHLHTQLVENRLRRLSMSPLPPAHGAVGKTAGHDMADADTGADNQATEQRGISSLADQLSKLRPEYFCDPVKTYDKMTFRELIHSCTKVLCFLRTSHINVDGYLSHLSFVLDKAAMGVYITEGLVL